MSNSYHVLKPLIALLGAPIALSILIFPLFLRVKTLIARVSSSHWVCSVQFYLL